MSFAVRAALKRQSLDYNDIQQERVEAPKLGTSVNPKKSKTTVENASKEEKTKATVFSSSPVDPSSEASQGFPEGGNGTNCSRGDGQRVAGTEETKEAMTAIMQTAEAPDVDQCTIHKESKCTSLGRPSTSPQ